MAAWFGWLLALALLIYFLVTGPEEEREMRAIGLAPGLMVQFSTVAILCVGPVMVREILVNEPEPLPPEGDAAIAEAYTRHRRANARMVYLGLMCVLLFFHAVELSFRVLLEAGIFPGGTGVPAASFWLSARLGLCKKEEAPG